MTHYLDLSTSCMVEEGPHVRAVGWLNPLFPFDTGDVSPELISKLREHCTNPFQPMRLRGYHDCEFKLDESTECKATGLKNIWIPSANGCLYVAPEMIVHYIEVHSYRPPEEFEDRRSRRQLKSLSSVLANDGAVRLQRADCLWFGLKRV